MGLYNNCAKWPVPVTSGQFTRRSSVSITCTCDGRQSASHVTATVVGQHHMYLGRSSVSITCTCDGRRSASHVPATVVGQHHTYLGRDGRWLGSHVPGTEKETSIKTGYIRLQINVLDHSAVNHQRVRSFSSKSSTC